MIFPKFTSKSIEKELSKPNIFYFIISEGRNKSIKESIYSITSYFLNSSGIEKYISESTNEDTKEKDLPNLSPKSLVKLPKDGDFSDHHREKDLSLEESDYNKGLLFFDKMHYLLSYLLSKESNYQIQLSILKAFCFSLILKAPYAKLSYGLVSETILPYVNSNFRARSKSLNVEKEQYQENPKYAKINLQVMHVVKALLSVKELKSEMREAFWWYDYVDKHKTVFANFLIPNETHLEALAMVGRNYPEVLYWNWETLKPFLDEVLQIENHKLHLALLKMLEEWLNNFNKDYNKSDGKTTGSETDENHTRGSSSSTYSKRSDEEDKISIDSQDFEGYLSMPKTKQSQIRYNPNDVSPFNFEDFRAFVKDTFLWFLDGHDIDSKSIILNVLSFLKEENWSIFSDAEVVTIIRIIHASRNTSQLKPACIKFFGYIIYHKRFNQDKELINDVIERLYGYRKETNMQIWLRNSWAIANICCTWDLDSLDTGLTAKLLSVSLKYSHSNKEKIISNSTRALGYVLSRWNELTLSRVLEKINGSQELYLEALLDHKDFNKSLPKDTMVTVDFILQLLLDKVNNTSPKISWNAWVSLGHLIEVEHIRNFEWKVLFSHDCFSSLLDIIRERPNYKTKIHATQTLGKFKSFEEYGDNFFEILYLSLVTLKDLSTVTDDTEYKYIENLEMSLIDLCTHMMNWLNSEQSTISKMSSFLKDNLELIRTTAMSYLKSRLLSPTLSSSIASTLEDKEESLRGEPHSTTKLEKLLHSDDDLRAVCAKVKELLLAVKDFIDSYGTVQVKFSVYQDIARYAEASIEDYASIVTEKA